MRAALAILLGKSIIWTTKFFKLGGGSAAPGLYALKVDPSLVSKLTSKIPTNIIITGTNGKTTTARMLSHFAKAAGLKVIRNHTGSNLERGIASTLIQHSNVKFDLGVWELDEAAFNSLALQIKPDMMVFLNAFRDQLDRYGEVDSVVKKWIETLKKIDENCQILVNGDDVNTSSLGKQIARKTQKFGVLDFKIIGESIIQKKEKENLDYEAKNVKQQGLSNTSFQLKTNKELLNVNLPLPGIYHIYDFLAAFALGKLLNLPSKTMLSSLTTFSPAFGRVEKLDFGYIFLIKNPAGATQVFATISTQIKEGDRLLLALNDNLADGKDVSWIWDAQFEQLKTKNNKIQIICSGTRAYDLANRLKYAGFDPNKILVQPSLEVAFKEAREGLKGQLFILPTYTALLEIQAILTKSGIKKNYWEED